jgi:hypothetical protein
MKNEKSNSGSKDNMRTKQIAIVILLILLTAGTAYAIIFHVLPAVKMYQAGGNLQESLVIVDSFDLNGNKKVQSVSVTLNNTDTIVHTVNVYISLEDSGAVEIGSGTSLNNVIPAGVTNVLTVPLTVKPALVDVSQTIITVKEQ